MIRFALTTLGPDVHMIRVLVGDGPAYDRMIVVSEYSGGRILFLQGWIGKPLSPREWREGHARYFPAAREIRFKRVNSQGGERLAILHLTRGHA